MQRSDGAFGRFEIVAVGQGTNQSGNHLQTRAKIVAFLVHYRVDSKNLKFVGQKIER